jgi:hypothetical protein
MGQEHAFKLPRLDGSIAPIADLYQRIAHPFAVLSATYLRQGGWPAARMRAPEAVAK